MKRLFLTSMLMTVALLVGPAASEAATELRHEAELRIVVHGQRGDQEFVVRAPAGAPIRVEGYSEFSFQLVPTFLSTSRDSKPSIGLEFYETLDLGEREASNLLGAVSLAKGRVVAIPGAGGLLEVEALGIVAVPAEANFRPRDCCVSCDGYTACGAAVDGPCGSCNIRN